MRGFLRRCDAVAVSNPRLAEGSRVLRCAAERIRIIPLGVRTGDYAAPRADDLGRAEELLGGLPRGGFKVMFAGRMVYYKGVSRLLEAISILAGDGAGVSAFLVGSGAMEREAREFSEANGLGGRVKFISPQPERVYRALFHLADCFALPSTHRTEAYGIVLLEAMASGLPVISTELGTGTSWINEDGRTGLVVPPGDSAALAAAIGRLAQRGDERARMGAAARERAVEVFEESSMIDAYERLFGGP
jgi:rhamnosyl/mannosyltransferase